MMHGFGAKQLGQCQAQRAQSAELKDLSAIESTLDGSLLSSITIDSHPLVLFTAAVRHVA
jgi:hypothetical protein